MESILNQISNVMLLGSIAVLVWGGILTVGQLFTAGQPRDPKPARRSGDARRRRLGGGLILY